MWKYFILGKDFFWHTFYRNAKIIANDDECAMETAEQFGLILRYGFVGTMQFSKVCDRARFFGDIGYFYISWRINYDIVQ